MINRQRIQTAPIMYLYIRLKEKNKLYHDFLKCKDQDLLAAFKKYRSKLTYDLKNAKQEYYKHLSYLVQSDPKKIWEAVNSITNKHSHFQGYKSRDY